MTDFLNTTYWDEIKIVCVKDGVEITHFVKNLEPKDNTECPE